jgi:hypothetical protein
MQRDGVDHDDGQGVRLESGLVRSFRVCCCPLRYCVIEVESGSTKGLDQFKSYNLEETLRRGRILKFPSGDTRNLNMLIVGVQANEKFDTSLCLITRTRAFIELCLDLL